MMIDEVIVYASAVAAEQKKASYRTGEHGSINVIMLKSSARNKKKATDHFKSLISL